MMKKILFTAIVIFSGSFGQSVMAFPELSIVGGAGITAPTATFTDTTTGGAAQTVTSTGKVGYGGGILLAFTKARAISFELGALYMQRTYSLDAGNFGTGVTGSMVTSF